MSPVARARPIQVLLIEDNPHDADLVMRTFQEAGHRSQVHLATDGAEALDFLRQRGPHAGAPRPDLILLDLTLPKTDGRDLPEEIKDDEELRRIPVVVLTGSAAEGDVARSYQRHANAYVRKPVDPVAFLSAIHTIEHFWLDIVRLP